MLPTNNWIPTVLGDDRFPTVDIPLPEPITGRYLDFAKHTPTNETNPIGISVLSSGENNMVEGNVGRDDDFSATLEVTLTLGSVYGCILADRMTVPAVRGISSGARGELPNA